MTRTQSRTWPAAMRERMPGVALLASMLLALAACGGSGGGTQPVGETPAATCDPNDPATAEECGILYVAMTDADGDFVSYTVDVVSLTLEKANGAVVETLPNTARLDFADYIDLTELVSAAQVPPGTYVAGSITLDYSEAEIFVESDGVAVEAVAVDADGEPLTRAELRIQLAERDHLVIRRGVPAVLTVDFDLAASHAVDLASSPVEVTVEPFIVAELEPVDEKDIRVRGPLVSVDVAGSSYVVDLRPFHRRDGDFGEVPVRVTAETEYEVDGEPYGGEPGLEALDAAGAGTPTVAFGTLDVSAREFTASLVLAGTSVPGIDFDAVKGHVIARDGNELTVLGATIIPSDRRAYFRDRVIVTVGPDTKVVRNGHPDQRLDIGAISVGQRVLVRGIVDAAASTGITMDATAGGVRLFVTRLAGLVNQAVPGQVDVDLATIGGRRVALFDFAGTGLAPETDADPDNYEIATGELAIGNDVAPGFPVRAFGYPAAFGFAPPDFEGRTVVDLGGIRAALGIGWTREGSTAPFLAIGPEGLVPDTSILGEDQRHYIRIGPVLIDILDIEGGISIVPAEAGRSLYAIRSADSLRLYRDFAEFAEDLATALDGMTAARSMYAYGRFDEATGEFSASKIGILLKDPE